MTQDSGVSPGDKLNTSWTQAQEDEDTHDICRL